MTMPEVVAALRRRWLSVLLVLIATLGVTVFVLLTTPQSWTSTATLGLVPGDPAAGLDGVAQVANAAPLYAEAARSSEVRERARSNTPGVEASTSVRTFRETPTVIKIDSVSTDGESARAATAAYVAAFTELAREGSVLREGLVEVKVLDDASTPTSPSSPQTGVVLLAGSLAGLLLGAAVALAKDARSRR